MNIIKLFVNKNLIFGLLLLLATTLHAQERQITLEGANFSVGELLEEIEAQTDITIVNRIPVADRGEVVGQMTSPEMVRDVVDQALAGTTYIYRSAATYVVVTVERSDDRGSRVLEQVFVEPVTGAIVGIGEIFGEALGTNVGTIDQMLVSQVLSGRAYSYHSTGTYTIVTVMVDEGGTQVERQIAVDMATGNIVPIDRLLNPGRFADDGFSTYTFPGTEYLPRFSLKANLLYGATTTINLGAEFLLNRYLTLDISTGWNPFVYSNNKKFAHWMIQPTLRYWFQEPFNGHFLGASLMYSNFNVGGIKLPFDMIPALENRRYRGDAYSVSLQYGHQWALSPRWAIEASLNAGYMFLNYQEFECGWCGEKIGSDRRHYLGPTNAAISLIYIIK
jgi:hypothetical protein